jgi:hypothetical protein
MLAERAKAMQRVCFDREPSSADLELLGSPERWLVYRELVQSRLVNVIGVALARTKAAIGREAFGLAVADWLAAGGPKTRFLRHVPNELADFAIPIWRLTEAPWVAELARFEITSWKVRHGEKDSKSVGELAFDTKPVLSTATEVLRLDYPVHRKPIPDGGYGPDPVVLMVYRDARHQASARELNPLAADLMEAWKRGAETVSESVERVARAHGTEIGPAFVEKLSALIADSIERGILLGSGSAQ